MEELKVLFYCWRLHIDITQSYTGVLGIMGGLFQLKVMADQEVKDMDN